MLIAKHQVQHAPETRCDGHRHNKRQPQLEKPCVADVGAQQRQGRKEAEEDGIDR